MNRSAIDLATEQQAAIGETDAVVRLEDVTMTALDRRAREDQQVATQLFRLRFDPHQQRRIEVRALVRERGLVGEDAEDLVAHAGEAPGRRVGDVDRRIDHLEDALASLIGDAHPVALAPIEHERDCRLADSGQFGDLLLGHAPTGISSQPRAPLR